MVEPMSADGLAPEDSLTIPLIKTASSKKRKSLSNRQRAPRSEDDDDDAPREKDWITRCPCGGDDEEGGFMIMCDKCQVWQHAQCVGVTKNNVPSLYLCDQCDPISYAERIEKLRRQTQGIKRKKMSRGGVMLSNPALVAARRNSTESVAAGLLENNSAPVAFAAGMAISAEFPSEKKQRTIETKIRAPSAEVDMSMDVDGGDQAQNSKISREDRKLQQYVNMIQKMENNPDRKRRMGLMPTGGATPPDSRMSTALSPNNTVSQRPLPLISASSTANASFSANAKKRRNSRSSSISNEDFVDLDVLKASPELLKIAYPLSPMYLGRKTWMVNCINAMNGNASSRNPVYSRVADSEESKLWSVKRRMLASISNRR